MKSDIDPEELSLPPPSFIKRVNTWSGEKSLIASYHFMYSPQSWKEWQRLAGIKIQIGMRLKGVIFEEYEPSDSIERVYTIAEFGKYFTAFIKFHKPLYPGNKKEFMRSLTIYAKRLHYEKMLHFEAVMAMSIRFNSLIGTPFSLRELNRKTRAIFELDKEEWKVKLSKNELHKALSNAAKKSAEVKREKSSYVREKVFSLRNEGKTLQSISDTLDISLSTARRYIASVDHIDKG